MRSSTMIENRPAANPALLSQINAELGLIDGKLQDQVDVQSGPLGSRPDKFTFTGRYQLPEEWVRGVSVGGDHVEDRRQAAGHCRLVA